MEPLSTLALVAAFLVPVPLTKRPDWNEQPKAINVFSDPTDVLVSPSAETLTASLLVPIQPAVWDRSDFLVGEVQTYRDLKDGWDGKGSKAVTQKSFDAALQFIRCLPGGLPLPKAMVSSVGEVGFYWDLPEGFADISFGPDGVASFFSRHSNGHESFFDDLETDVFTRTWFFDVLGAMAAPLHKAA
jgi:hypothetical protein